MSTGEDDWESSALCSVCLDLFEEPVLLSCAHNLCLKCAKKLFEFESKLSASSEALLAVTTSNNNNAAARMPSEHQERQRSEADPVAPMARITCPECRAPTVLTATTATDLEKELKVNVSLRNLVANLRECRKKKATETVMCGICEASDAVAECKECQFALCASCRDNDHQRGKFKSHEVLPLGKLSKVRPRKCKEHETYVTDLYCEDCGAVVCLLCNYMGAHKGHNVKPLTQAVEDIRGEVSRGVAQLQQQRTEVGAAVEQMVSALPALTQHGVAMSNQIKKTFSELKAVLTAREHMLLEKVTATVDAKAATINTQTQGLHALQKELDEVVANCTRVMEDAHDCDVAKLFHTVAQRMASAADTHEKVLATHQPVPLLVRPPAAVANPSEEVDKAEGGEDATQPEDGVDGGPSTVLAESEELVFHSDLAPLQLAIGAFGAVTTRAEELALQRRQEMEVEAEQQRRAAEMPRNRGVSYAFPPRLSSEKKARDSVGGADSVAPASKVLKVGGPAEDSAGGMPGISPSVSSVFINFPKSPAANRGSPPNRSGEGSVTPMVAAAKTHAPPAVAQPTGATKKNRDAGAALAQPQPQQEKDKGKPAKKFVLQI